MQHNTLVATVPQTLYDMMIVKIHVTVDCISSAHEQLCPPTFVVKMRNSRALEGDGVRFECKVTASPTPQLYWKKDKEMLRIDPMRMRSVSPLWTFILIFCFVSLSSYTVSLRFWICPHLFLHYLHLSFPWSLIYFLNTVIKYCSFWDPFSATTHYCLTQFYTLKLLFWIHFCVFLGQLPKENIHTKNEKDSPSHYTSMTFFHIGNTNAIL